MNLPPNLKIDGTFWLSDSTPASGAVRIQGAVWNAPMDAGRCELRIALKTPIRVNSVAELTMQGLLVGGKLYQFKVMPHPQESPFSGSTLFKILGMIRQGNDKTLPNADKEPS